MNDHNNGTAMEASSRPNVPKVGRERGDVKLIKENERTPLKDRRHQKVDHSEAVDPSFISPHTMAPSPSPTSMSSSQTQWRRRPHPRRPGSAGFDSNATISPRSPSSTISLFDGYRRDSLPRRRVSRSADDALAVATKLRTMAPETESDLRVACTMVLSSSPTTTLSPSARSPTGGSHRPGTEVRKARRATSDSSSFVDEEAGTFFIPKFSVPTPTRKPSRPPIRISTATPIWATQTGLCDSPESLSDPEEEEDVAEIMLTPLEIEGSDKRRERSMRKGLLAKRFSTEDRDATILSPCVPARQA